MIYKYLTLKYIYLILSILTLVSCANQGTLTGGVKDDKPPTALKFIPEKNSVNFSSKKIEIFFDEFIKINNPSAIYISPPISSELKVNAYGKKLIIDGLDSLNDNTTYTLRFGESIVDNNEGNSLNDFNYCFSTGDEIDSSIIKVKVLNTIDKKLLENVLVALYLNLSDSIIFNSKPAYYSYTNKEGLATIINIKEGQYRLVAIDDLSKNLYLDDAEGFAFNTSYIDVTVDTLIEYDLHLSEQIAENISLDYTLTSKSSLFINFSSPIESYTLSDDKIKEFNLNFTRDTLFLLFDNELDKHKFQIEYDNQIDTLDIDFSLFKIEKKSLQYKLEYSYSNNSILIAFKEPIAKFNPEGINMYIDSVEQKIGNFKLQNGSKSLMITPFDTSTLTSASIAIDSAAFKSVNGNFNIGSYLSIGIPSIDKFGSLSFVFESEKYNNANLLVQLEDDNSKVIRTKLINSSEELKFEFLKEGKYKLRIVVDLDNNGYWTSINAKELIQAEPIIVTDIYEVNPGWEALENKILLD